MDHETLLLALTQARTNIATTKCPWCGAIDWSAGALTTVAMHSINRDGEAVFVYQAGAPKTTLVSAVFTCQDCHYQIAFTLRNPNDPTEEHRPA